jgi:putative tricarboxylic transport membrane protein
MTAQRTDLITGGAIAVIGAVYYIATFSIQETANIVTPRTFPAIVGIALIVLGLFLAGQAVYRARKAALAEAGPGEPHQRDGGRERCGRLGGGVGGLGGGVGGLG